MFVDTSFQNIYGPKNKLTSLFYLAVCERQSKNDTVKLDFKNRQVKNQLGFKNQINNDQLDQISFKNRQDKNNLTLRTKMSVTKYVLKVKFDCIQ